MEVRRLSGIVADAPALNPVHSAVCRFGSSGGKLNSRQTHRRFAAGAEPGSAKVMIRQNF